MYVVTCLNTQSRLAESDFQVRLKLTSELITLSIPNGVNYSFPRVEACELVNLGMFRKN